MEPKLRKPGQSKAKKDRLNKLSDALVELLKPNSIMGLNNLRNKLEEATKEEIHPDTIRNLIKKDDRIGVQIRGKGLENIYSFSE